LDAAVHNFVMPVLVVHDADETFRRVTVTWVTGDFLSAKATLPRVWPDQYDDTSVTRLVALVAVAELVLPFGSMMTTSSWCTVDDAVAADSVPRDSERSSGDRSAGGVERGA
jgi:hypothetical protein